MKAKKRILLNWWYDRADLLEPFVKLKEEIDFTLIFYKKPGNNSTNQEFPVIYWDEFHTPYELLEKVNPDEVVFVNIDDAPYQISLNIACKSKGIKTSICDHGIRGFAEIPVYKVNFGDDKLRTFRFLFSSLSKSKITLLPYFIVLLFFKLIKSDLGRTGTLLRKLRKPDRYICYTNSSANFFKIRDLATISEIEITGNPTFDSYFSLDLERVKSSEKYFLLIDQPFVKSKFGKNLLTIKQKNEFLIKLAEFCSGQDHKLIVKLHPDDFGQDYYVSNPSIKYIDNQVSNEELLHNCTGVFGFYSTLLIPAIFLKKAILFQLKPLEIQRLWEEMGVVKLLDFYSFSKNELDFDSLEPDANKLKTFSDHFIYKPDGHSQERLRSVLLGNS